jgi:hypothetical protein
MATATLTDFDKQYLETWIEPDPQKRRENIEQLWSADGRLVVSSLGLTIQGVEDIVAHIAHVYDENIAAKGLRFAYDQHVDSGDAVLLRWSMLAPNGATVARGADVLFRDADARVTTAYMFMGVD